MKEYLPSRVSYPGCIISWAGTVTAGFVEEVGRIICLV